MQTAKVYILHSASLDKYYIGMTQDLMNTPDSYREIKIINHSMAKANLLRQHPIGSYSS